MSRALQGRRTRRRVMPRHDGLGRTVRYRGNYSDFIRHLREGIGKLGCAAVVFEVIAGECERLTAS